MNGLFSGVAARAALRSAHACVDELTASVGVSGLAAVAESAGLRRLLAVRMLARMLPAPR
jgi:hypothetical protein